MCASDRGHCDRACQNAGRAELRISQNGTVVPESVPAISFGHNLLKVVTAGYAVLQLEKTKVCDRTELRGWKQIVNLTSPHPIANSFLDTMPTL